MPPEANATDQRLLEAARAGDRQALAALLERNQARVYHFGMKMCGNPEDAEERKCSFQRLALRRAVTTSLDMALHLRAEICVDLSFEMAGEHRHHVGTIWLRCGAVRCQTQRPAPVPAGVQQSVRAALQTLSAGRA